MLAECPICHGDTGVDLGDSKVKYMCTCTEDSEEVEDVKEED